MSESGHGSPDDERGGAKRKPWFKPNTVGAGYHPASWQGWAILAGAVAVIVIVVVLWRTGQL